MVLLRKSNSKKIDRQFAHYFLIKYLKNIIEIWFLQVYHFEFLSYRGGFQKKRILKRNLKRSAHSTYKPVVELYTPSSPDNTNGFSDYRLFCLHLKKFECTYIRYIQTMMIGAQFVVDKEDICLASVVEHKHSLEGVSLNEGEKSSMENKSSTENYGYTRY